MDYKEIACALVRKLAYMGKWGASHTSFDNLPKGFPSHLRGDVKKVAEKLIKQNILLAKPTSYGIEVSLNPDRKADIEAVMRGGIMKLGIVVSEYYWEEVTSKMLDLAVITAKDLGAEVEVVKVPGSFDIPLGVKKLLKKGVDGVVTLGAVVRGDTAHDEVICYTVADALTRLALEFEKPVVLGVNGPRMSYEQAVERIGRAADVTKACVGMVKRLR